ncbi:hypothetical protein BDZ97DRAFT_74237 [Flammula alnicola]|nr:hypothetical protein BDZ97DRAFT_74237 [Flammula alnicola]
MRNVSTREPKNRMGSCLAMCTFLRDFCRGLDRSRGVDTDLIEKSTSGSMEPFVSAAVEMTPGSCLAKKIAHLVLVDPVPILLSSTAVAHNFLYRQPSTVCRHTLGSAHDCSLGAGLSLPTTSSPESVPLTKLPQPS